MAKSLRNSRAVKLIIIGTGFGGLAAAIRMKQRKDEDFIVLERAEDVGGVWRDNHYPGCACDVQSHLYSYSFAPNPNWSHEFSRQPEIHAYLRNCARDAGVLEHVRFSTNVQRLSWNERAGEWIVNTDQGEYRGRYIVSGMGSLSDPIIPTLKVPTALRDAFSILRPGRRTSRWKASPSRLLAPALPRFSSSLKSSRWWPACTFFSARRPG
jgi:cation diffusion facilitator CzcD-associated flavoprotein CzcO